ncbi:hypothetical protein NH340_JMT02256 [Sarcoptes scabiei]|nr:hypothetical protein NH340_JMT02256 [Sarcoptes scabiei]
MEPQQILICNEPSPMSPSPPSTSMAMKMSTTTTTTSITAHTRIRLDSSLSSTSTTSTISSIRGDRSITNLFDSPNSSSSGYDSNLSTMSQHSFDDDFDDEIENDENLGRNHHHHHPHHHHPRQQTRSSINDGSNNDPFVIAGKLDQHMLDDNQRILRNLLSIEDRCIPWNVDTIVYQSTQYQITDSIRSELIDWMFEVCEAFRCEEGIFALSVNYLDRILLAIPTLPKSQLQLTAVVCMLIASKIRQCTVMDPIDLSVATDHTCSVSDILIWEPIILKRLNWDVSSVIATDYLDSILLFVEKILKRFVCEQKPKQEQNSQMKFDQSNLEDDFDDENLSMKI